MKMKIMLAIVAVTAICGCSRDAVPAKINSQINDVMHGVSQPCKKWGGQADVLLSDILALPKPQLKIECLHRLAAKVLETDVSAPRLEDPRSTANAVIDLCRGRIPAVMRLSGGTIEDVWDVYIPLLSWMRKQADKLYDDGKLPNGMTRLPSGGLRILDHEAYRQYAKRRDAYDMVVSAYDGLLNLAEQRFPDWYYGKIDESKIPALKERIEKFLGRPMRTRKQCEEDWYSRKSDFPKWPGRQAPLKKPKAIPNVDVEVKFQDGVK